jgi:hypothetical protein
MWQEIDERRRDGFLIRGFLEDFNETLDPKVYSKHGNT